MLDVTCGRETIDENIDFFISEIEKYNPKTAYDVEKLSYDVLFKSTGLDIFNCIKNYLYFTSEEIQLAGIKIKINLFIIIMAMSIYLRDKYLEKYPEFIKNALLPSGYNAK